jgi:molybdate transport system substrate-binding protein
MKQTMMVAVCAAMLAAGCGPSGETLHVLSGSSMTEPMEELCKMFEIETGVSIELTLGGCETLFPQIELGAPADVFIGHDPFGDMLAEKDLRHDRMVDLGAIKPSVVVGKGNPKNINTLKDLARDDVRVGLPDARFSTCGEMFEAAATERNMIEAIHERTVYTARTHQELATALRTGSVDVVVVWNFIAAMHKERFDVVEIDIEFPEAGVFATRVKQSKSPIADKLLDFLDTDRARAVFVRLGFGDEPAEGWAIEDAVLRIYCAAGVAKPIDELTEMFSKRHPSVRFETVYEGSGTLLTKIDINRTGDLYVAADDVYMERATEKGLLVHAKRMAVFTPVLAVPKGNPKNIRSFADLTKDGVRLGLGDDKAAAVGQVALRLLKEKGLWPEVQKNLVVTAATVNQLAIQAGTGSLDAAIIWDATLWQNKERLEEVDRGGPDSQVGVPLGVLQCSDHHKLAESFMEFATSAQAADVFRRHGFVPAVDTAAT